MRRDQWCRYYEEPEANVKGPTGILWHWAKAQRAILEQKAEKAARAARIAADVERFEAYWRVVGPGRPCVFLKEGDTRVWVLPYDKWLTWDKTHYGVTVYQLSTRKGWWNRDGCLVAGHLDQILPPEDQRVQRAWAWAIGQTLRAKDVR